MNITPLGLQDWGISDEEKKRRAYFAMGCRAVNCPYLKTEKSTNAYRCEYADLYLVGLQKCPKPSWVDDLRKARDAHISELRK